MINPRRLAKQAVEKATSNPDEDEVGQQAVEMWSTICDEELELIEDAAELPAGQQPARQCLNFVRGALPHLVPLLLNALFKKTEARSAGREGSQCGVCTGTGDVCARGRGGVGGLGWGSRVRT